MAKLTLREKEILAKKREGERVESKEVRSGDKLGMLLLGGEFDGLFFDMTFYRACREIGISRVESEKEWLRLVRSGLVEWEKNVGGVEAFRRKVK